MDVDKMGKIRNTLIRNYYKLPPLFQDAISSIYIPARLPFKLGGLDYIKKCNLFLKSQWWSREKLEHYQLKRLNLLIDHIYRNVPYYKRVFNKLKLKPKDIKSVKDLEKIPILTREDVVNNFDDLFSKNIDRSKLQVCQTSGSTGKPLNFCRDQNNKITSTALYARCLNTMGHRMSDRMISLEFTFFLNRKEFTKNCVYDKLFRNLYLSSRAHTSKDFDDYLRIIKKFKPSFIQGNPSVIYLLACYAEEKNIEDIKFKSFLSLFENLYAFQKDKISKIFGCEIFNYYCSREHVVSAMDCNQHNGLHIEIEKGILETVDAKGHQIYNKTGRIIATGLNDFAMPLIRYELGDYGILSKKKCVCGRGAPILNSIEGRTVGVLKYRNKFVYPTTLSLLIWKFKSIKECQFIQENNDELILNIVKRKMYSKKDTQKLIGLIKKVLNDENIKIKIHFTKFIPRDKIGKFEFVIRKE